MKEINAAFEVLSDPVKRARYDKFELPNIERQQREQGQRTGADGFRTEAPRANAKKEDNKEDKTGGFEYEDEPAQQDKWSSKPAKRFDEDEEEKERQKEQERQKAERERLEKDGEHKVKDDDKVIGTYTKAGNKMSATLGDDEGVNKKMLDQMIDHALKVSKPPLKISGGGEFMHQAMKACKERGIEYKNGNLPSFGR
jgi:curved DNA-binding protein CbpA